MVEIYSLPRYLPYLLYLPVDHLARCQMLQTFAPPAIGDSRSSCRLKWPRVWSRIPVVRPLHAGLFLLPLLLSFSSLFLFSTR